MFSIVISSAVDVLTNNRVAIKKLARPFQSAVHAKRTYRELKLLKHMRHENVIGLLNVFYPQNDTTQVILWFFNYSLNIKSVLLDVPDLPSYTFDGR